MAGKNTAVFGIYPTYAGVETGVDALRSAGFRNDDISALFPEGVGTRDFAHQKNTKAPEGATTGLGPFIAAGPIMAALAGAGLGGAVGGIAGALIGMGIPEYEAKRYEGRVKDGGILLSVHSDNSDQTKRAKEILKRTGAQDISSSGEAGSDDKSENVRLPRAV
jgi:hypothetical protein